LAVIRVLHGVLRGLRELRGAASSIAARLQLWHGYQKLTGTYAEARGYACTNYGYAFHEACACNQRAAPSSAACERKSSATATDGCDVRYRLEMSCAAPAYSTDTIGIEGVIARMKLGQISSLRGTSNSGFPDTNNRDVAGMNNRDSTGTDNQYFDRFK
jgi:hypothetical protein